MKAKSVCWWLKNKDEFQIVREMMFAFGETNWKETGLELKGGEERQQRAASAFLKRLFKVCGWKENEKNMKNWTDALLSFNKKKCRTLHDMWFASSYIFNRLHKSRGTLCGVEECDIVEEWGLHYLNQSNMRAAAEKRELRLKRKLGEVE